MGPNADTDVDTCCISDDAQIDEIPFICACCILWWWFDFCHLKLPHHWLRIRPVLNTTRDIDQCNKSNGDLIPKSHTTSKIVSFESISVTEETNELNVTPMRRTQTENILISKMSLSTSNIWKIDMWLSNNANQLRNTRSYSRYILWQFSNDRHLHQSQPKYPIGKNYVQLWGLKMKWNLFFMTHLLFCQVCTCMCMDSQCMYLYWQIANIVNTLLRLSHTCVLPQSNAFTRARLENDCNNNFSILLTQFHSFSCSFLSFSVRIVCLFRWCLLANQQVFTMSIVEA